MIQYHHCTNLYAGRLWCYSSSVVYAKYVLLSRRLYTQLKPYCAARALLNPIQKNVSRHSHAAWEIFSNAAPLSCLLPAQLLSRSLLCFLSLRWWALEDFVAADSVSYLRKEAIFCSNKLRELTVEKWYKAGVVSLLLGCLRNL